MDIATGKTTVLTRGVEAQYARSGHLIVLAADGSVQAVRFDAGHLTLIGRPMTVLDGVAVGSEVEGASAFALSNTGTFIYQTALPKQQVMRVTRDGRAVAPAVSARGEVACAIERDDACDVATVPLDGSAWPVRVSHADYAWDPAWSADSRRSRSGFSAMNMRAVLVVAPQLSRLADRPGWRKPPQNRAWLPGASIFQWMESAFGKA